MPLPLIPLIARLAASGAAGGGGITAPLAGTQLAGRAAGAASSLGSSGGNRLLNVAGNELASGAAIKGVGALGQAVSGLLHPAQLASKAVAVMGNVLGHVTTPFKVAADAINTVHAAISTVEAPFKALEAMFGHAASYTQKFSPAKVEFYTRAVDDFHASIGQRLSPVVEAGTKIFRMFGDTVQTVGPKLDPIIQAVSALAVTFVDNWTSLYSQMGEFAILLPVIIEGLKSLNFLWKQVAKIASGVGGGVRAARNGDNPISGAMAAYERGPSSARTGSASNMAFHSAQNETIQSMRDRIQAQAYGYGSSGGQEKPDTEVGLLQKLVKYFVEGDFVKNIKEAVKASPGEFANGARDYLHESASTGLDRLRQVIRPSFPGM